MKPRADSDSVAYNAPVIHLIYGDDDYRVHQAVQQIRDGLGDDNGMLESNTTALDGRRVTPQELIAHATAVPFLADNRLVIVEGLIGALAQVKGGRAKKKAAADDPLEPWRQAAAQLGDKNGMPESTTLVFLDAAVTKSHPAFAIFSPIALTRECAHLNPGDLVKWVNEEARDRELKISPTAVRHLVSASGSDLWALKNDLDKLEAFAAGQPIDEQMAVALIAGSQETKFWDLTDAVVAGNERKAIAALRRMLVDGQPPPLLASMLARQYRQLVLVKDARERGASEDETAKISGVPGFKVREVSGLASRYSWPVLRTVYATLLDADLSVKRGLQDDESSLQLLVHELCALHPPAAARSARPR